MEKYFDIETQDIVFTHDIDGNTTYYEFNFRVKDIESHDPDNLQYDTMMHSLGYDYAGLERIIVTDNDGKEHEEYWDRWFKFVG